MDKIINKINKLSLPATILIASLILGGFYYASEANKLRTSERQQEIKLQEEKSEQDRIKFTQEQNKIALNTCIRDAENNYTLNWNKSCKTRGLENECSLPGDLAKNIDDHQQQLKDDCFKKYPQK